MKRDELIQTLQDYQAHFSAEAADLACLAAQLKEDEEDMLARANMRGHLTSSALVLNTARDAVLFIHHKAHDMWLQPGGHYEAPGSLWDSACREVAEETGLHGIILHDWHHRHAIPFDIHSHDIPARPAKNEGPHRHHDALYVALAPQDEVGELQASEISGVRWIPVSELTQIPGLRLARLLPKLKEEGIL